MHCCSRTFDEWFYYINDLMCYDKVNQHMVVPPEADINIQSAAKETAFRFVASMDDFATSSVFTSKYFEGRLRDSGHYVEVDICAGGHLMDPPYFPSHEIVFAKYADKTLVHAMDLSNIALYVDNSLSKPGRIL
uniref:BAAT_C domain-containing protein n=2 Tax=Heterorhabditis bacteriophora TaxID=37862 RepID=A0A1I7XCI1_HETBA